MATWSVTDERGIVVDSGETYANALESAQARADLHRGYSYAVRPELGDGALGRCAFTACVDDPEPFEDIELP